MLKMLRQRLDDPDDFQSVQLKQMQAVAGKVQDKLKAENIQLFNEGWEPGETETKGVKVLAQLKDLSKKIGASISFLESLNCESADGIGTALSLKCRALNSNVRSCILFL